VRLVDDEQPDPRLCEPVDEPRGREALGGDVEQPHLARDRALQCGGVLGSVTLGVDQLRPSLEPVDLILHQ
jgi:hypothetical protein